jgi:hypothetical protein
MKKKDKKKNSLEVPYNLQLLVIATLIATSAFQIGFYLYMVLFKDIDYNFQFFVNQIIFMLFPLIVFGLSYILTRRQTSIIDRMFLAILKSIVAVSIYSILTLLVNITMRYNYNGTNEPGFWQSNNVEYILMGAVALSVVLAHLKKPQSR